ncbi:DNA replication and repair protein RecN [Alkalibaculum bacchi]|uniref:DNA repair protein RecN n=1 Tax=Alkalibaculum bacchi TaxID=645887 RepID=A0A366I3S7_9FIRM|nr:DNA repair protein RecN [Alkalibaculum bacchi]RBP61797.1 DNA replication and repair protein RecN [Alkalibaculum bacchi]
MLLELNVRNFALIEHLNIQFINGFNVITGETGVGKSIILDALTMCLGNRASKDIIRKGKDKMTSQALFFIENPRGDLLDFLHNLGIEDVNNIILTREVTKSGKSIARINGLLVNVNDLRTVGSLLVDIHSQREHQSLLDKGKHIKILDEYIGSEVKEKIDILKSKLSSYNNLMKKRERIIKEEMQMEREKDLLDFQSKELSDFQLKEGEDEILESEYKLLSNGEMIYNYSNQAHEMLYLNEESIYNQLSVIIDFVEKIQRIDPKIETDVQQLKDARLLIEDTSFSIREYKDQIHFDQFELENLNQKIIKMDQLKKKYGPEIRDILKYKEYLRERLNIIENREYILEKIEEDLKRAKEEYLKVAKEISSIRKKYAQIFEKKITAEIKELAMDKAIFKVQQRIDRDKFHTTGIDDIEFYIKSNVGEDFKPLIKTASGGELSRVILAVKSVINLTDPIDTLIFDEIDTGISGRSAQVVAQKMDGISKSTQVICISHLPQIASMADAHYNVKKESKGEYTYTIFSKLNFEQRCVELAKMTSGAEVTQKSIEHAKEMLSMNGKNK